MRFTSFGTQAERCVNGCFCQSQPRGSVVVTREIKDVMSIGELAISIEERCVSCGRLIQQIDHVQQIRFLSASDGGG